MRLSIKNLTVDYGLGNPVLQQINFDDEITTLAVIGKSGCGKSTFLRVLGGLLIPRNGTIRVGNRMLAREERELLNYRRRVGFVFQQDGLFLHLSGRDNIARPLKVVHGYKQADAFRRADELLRRFGLANDGHKLPRELSGGQRQRIAIARAIAHRPELLLLDEPTSALDPEYTNEVLNMINELKESDVRFIIVTHEMGFARRSCAKVMLMEDGRIVEYGESETCFDHPETQAFRNFIADVKLWN